MENNYRFAWTHLYQVLEEYFLRWDGIAYVICPFISVEVLRRLAHRRGRQPTVVITNWRLDHMVTGVSHVETFTVCQEQGWTLYINDRLHAKLYSRGLDSAWVGSANLTEMATGAGKMSNLETMFFLPSLAPELRHWVHCLVARSRLVTRQLRDWYVQCLKLQPLRPDSSIELPALPIDLPDPFLISQLPASRSPRELWNVSRKIATSSSSTDEIAAAEHDLALYDVEPTPNYETFAVQLKRAFFQQAFTKALAREITPAGLRFGAVKEWIQCNCTDVPTPYRRQLTTYVQALYAWFAKLAPDQFEDTRPNYTHVLRRRANGHSR